MTKKISSFARYIPIIIFCCLYNIFLRDAPSPFLSENDSLWFVRKADSILQGNWLGEFNKLTLIKNPLYPIYIAFVKLLSIEYMLVTSVIQQLVCLYLLRALKIKNNLLNYFCFICLFIYPEFYTTYKATIIREDIEIILQILFIAFAINFFTSSQVKYVLFGSLIAGLGVINKDSGTAWKASYALLLSP